MAMKGYSHSPKLQHYSNFTIRLFNVISGLSLGRRSYPSAEKQSVYSTAPANWTMKLEVCNRLAMNVQMSRVSIKLFSSFYTYVCKEWISYECVGKKWRNQIFLHTVMNLNRIIYTSRGIFYFKVQHLELHDVRSSIGGYTPPAAQISVKKNWIKLLSK